MGTAEYTGKNGKTYNYKIIARDQVGGIFKVKLESFGNNPFSFWVDESSLFKEDRPQWTCNCGEKWKDCKRNRDSFSYGTRC